MRCDVRELTLWFRDEGRGEARLRELLERGWIGSMRNDGHVWKVCVVRSVRPGGGHQPSRSTEGLL